MSGACQLLRVRLANRPDPLAVYADQCAGGRKPHTAIFHSADTGQGNRRRSLVVLQSALRISLDGQQIRILPLSANGAAALHAVYGTRDEHFIDQPVAVNGIQSERQRLIEPSVFDELRRLLRALAPQRPADRRCLMLLGALSFELANRFERQAASLAADLPDYVFYLPELLLDIDHHSGTTELLAAAFDPMAANDLANRMRQLQTEIASIVGDVPDPPPQPTDNDGITTTEHCSDQQFREHVLGALQAIRNGDAFQIVLSRQWTLPCPDSFRAFCRLCRTNPSPYLFHVCDSAFTLFGASPESSLRFDARGRLLEIYPIAGTRPRGDSPDADARIEAELRQDRKEIAEHLMLVDLARNDIARICRNGSRRIPLLMGVDRYSHVMHLVSRVQGELDDGLDALHALRACLNMGTLTGAPKSSASRHIRTIEQQRRNFYGGAVGFIDAAGNLDTAITIRAATVIDNQAIIQAGAGIVLDSDPQAEANETRRKAQAMINAISGAIA